MSYFDSLECRRLSSVGVAALALLLAIEISASVVIKMSLEELVDKADVIVEGQVEAVYTQWDNGRQLTFTYVAVRVDDPLKGDRTRSLLIRQLGGRIGNYELTVPGMPRFRQEDVVILFLAVSGNGTFQVLGMNQGKYEIVEGYATSNLTGVDLLDKKIGAAVGTSVVHRLATEEFKNRIRGLVR